MRATPRPGITLRDLLPAGSPAAPLARAPVGAPILTVSNLVKEYPRQGATKTMSQLFRRGAAGSDAPVPGGGRPVVHGRPGGKRRALSANPAAASRRRRPWSCASSDATSGTIVFDGLDIGQVPAARFARHPKRAKIQMVFQDPTDSLNPRYTAARAIADPILRFGTAKGADAVRARCEDLARLVGLPVDLLDRFPHQLSGGQKARVGIARAIAPDPDLVILDEPTAALDVSVQAVVLNLLADLKATLGMSYLFVSHDLHVVRLLCDRVIVMKAGRTVEEGTAAEVLETPKAEYTRELIAAIPQPPA